MTRHSIREHETRARINVPAPSPTAPSTENRSMLSSIKLSPDTVAHVLIEPMAARAAPVRQVSHKVNSDDGELPLVRGNLIKS